MKKKSLYYLFITTILAAITPSCNSKKDKLDNIEYKIVEIDTSESKQGNRYVIDAVYETDNYSKNDIEYILNKIYKSVNDTASNKTDLKIYIRLYSSEKIRNTSISETIAKCTNIAGSFISYNDEKLEALKDKYNDDFFRITKLLKERNTDLYTLNKELKNRFDITGEEMINEFGENWIEKDNAEDLFLLEEKKLLSKKKDILKKYNLHDSIEPYIRTYLKYCK